MKRLALLLTLLGLAACRDQIPVEPRLDTGRPAFDNGSCTGDFHFGDNCTSADGSEGSHYRLAHISWRDLGSNKAEFTYTVALRSSFYPAGTVDLGDQRQLAIIHFGDGTTAQPFFTVTFVDAASDWFIAQASFEHQYGGGGSYTAYSEDCCRIGTASTPGWAHINNPDAWVRIETTVNFASTGSPETSLPAIVSCALDSVCSFSVAAVAPNGQAIRWRLATPEEMGGSTLDQPPGASIDATTGTYSWNTTGATLGSSDRRTVYSTQVVMETVSGTTVTSKSAIDFLIELTSAGNPPPQFTNSTPADGHVFTVSPGQTVNFSVSASDSDATDLVTLGILNAPAGASFPIPAAANPVSTTFSWSPGTADAGTSHVMNLLAQDGRGGSASRSVTIQVLQPTGTIAGVVTDSETQAPLAGVQVSVLNSNLSALTDATGAYTISNVPAGTHAVQAAKQYFENGSQTGLVVSDGGTTTVNFALVATHRSVTVNLSAADFCNATVTARSITTDAFFAQQATEQASSPTECSGSATFVLPARLKFAFGLHNEVVSNALDHKVWPNATPVPTDDGLPNRVGAVCVESNGSCTNAALTPDNVYEAIAAATPLLEDRTVSLGFHADVQPVVPCTLVGATYPAYVYVIEALDPTKLGTMPRNDFYPPGIGHYVDRVNSNTEGECQIKSVPAGHPVVVEAKDADGKVYRAVLTSGETSLVMEADPNLFYAYYLLDGYGDNASGKDDVTLVTFGTNRNADGTQGNTLLVKADSRAIQENGTAQFHIEVKDVRDASGAVIVQSILAKVICSKQKGTCQIAEVTGDNTRFLGVEGNLNSAGDGWVTVQFDVTGAVSAEVKVRAGVADGYDFAPNSGSNAGAPALPELRNGYAVWRRTALPGSSFEVAYP